jgi:hypothetical protein
LFLLRLWLEEPPQAEGEKEGDCPEKDGSITWHGKLQHVVRGEAHAFTGWDMMIDCLETMLLRDVTVPAAEGGTPDRKPGSDPKETRDANDEHNNGGTK